jgi:hypothetical protein
MDVIIKAAHRMNREDTHREREAMPINITLAGG